MTAKALGDGTNIVYTPVTPCRLVETRNAYPAVYENAGPFTAGEVRTYTIQSGNGQCVTQLPDGLHPAAVQLQVFGIPVNNVSGDIEVLPQGATFGNTADAGVSEQRDHLFHIDHGPGQSGKRPDFGPGSFGFCGGRNRHRGVFRALGRGIRDERDGRDRHFGDGHCGRSDRVDRG